MVRTRSMDTPESSHRGGAEEPMMALLRQLVDTTNRIGSRLANDNNNDRHTSYSDFLATQPPIFEQAREPLEANNWLRVIESKFGLLQYSASSAPPIGLCMANFASRCLLLEVHIAMGL